MTVRLGYADPPYPGCAHLYPENTEVDHAALIARLDAEFDGWVLHTSATRGLALLATMLASRIESGDVRCMSWVKGFAAFKRNVPVAYAWEPVFVKAARKPVVSKRHVSRDFIETPAVKASATLKRGLCGAKPEAVCRWAFEMMGARPEDELVDLYPGTGAVTRAWAGWRGLFALPSVEKQALLRAGGE